MCWVNGLMSGSDGEMTPVLTVVTPVCSHVQAIRQSVRRLSSAHNGRTDRGSVASWSRPWSCERADRTVLWLAGWSCYQQLPSSSTRRRRCVLQPLYHGRAGRRRRAIVEETLGGRGGLPSGRFNTAVTNRSVTCRATGGRPAAAASRRPAAEPSSWSTRRSSSTD